MGTNPAVHIASLHLYMFELQCVQRRAIAARQLPPVAVVCELYHHRPRHGLFFGTHAASRPYVALHIVRFC